MLARRVRASAALHARPLDRLVRTARRFAARVTIQYRGKKADGKAVVALLLLAVPADAEVDVEVEGVDEAECLAEVAAAIEGAGTPAGAPEAGRAGVAARPERTDGGAATGVIVRRPKRGAAPAARGKAEERARVEAAFERARVTTDALIALDELFADVFAAQRTVLDDEELLADVVARVERGVAAESAVDEAFAALAARFAALETAFAAERGGDVADVGERVLDALSLGAIEAAPGLAGGGPVVWVVEEATPSLVATLDVGRVVAVLSYRGGPTSHAAIIARARNVRLSFVTADAVAGFADGEWVRVAADGRIERVAAEPAGPAPAAAAGRAAAPGAAVAGGQGPATAAAGEPRVPAEAAEPARTRDGVSVALRANLGAPGDLAAARMVGAMGCGLLRTELLFAARRSAPSTDEQAALYARIARALAPHPLVVRLFDAGSDKPLAFLPGAGDEPNPQLGRRGVALLRAHPDVLRAQLLAVAAAGSASGADVRAMIPMIVDLADVEAVAALAPPGLALGAMIETPAAALLAPVLAPRLAFVSLGTNDLTQYTLARDRAGLDAATRGPHPAVLRLVHETARAAAAAGIECAVCGELAGDPLAAPVLIALGVGSLSMAPGQLAGVRAALAAADVSALRARVPAWLGSGDAAALQQLLSAGGARRRTP